MNKKTGLGRVAIYYRVSTDKQDFDSQKTAIDKWLQDLPDEKKPVSIKEYMDEAISGSTTKRPMFKALMDDAYRGLIDTLVVYRLDRFSRNASTAIRLILDLDDAGVAFISVTQPVLNLGHENPFRRTMLAAFAEIAEIERETIITRVKAGLEAARKRGVKLGAPSKINPQIIELIKKLRQQGKTIRQISKEVKLSLGLVHKVIIDLNNYSDKNL